MEQICINANDHIIMLAGLVITITSGVVNIIPAPDEIDNAILRFLSRVVHFVAVDIVTAVKK